MPDELNVFNNSPVVTPDLEGQGDEVGTENTSTNTPPESGQGEDTGTQGTESATSANEPEWAKEYKSPEDMYAALKNLNQSYNSLRPEYTRVTQELSTLRKGTLNQPITTPVQDQTNNVTQQVQVPQSSPEEVLLSKIQEIVKPVREQNAELMMQNEIAVFASQNPDFLELAPDINETFKAEPALWNLTNPLQVAYSLTKAKKLASEVGKAVTQAKEEAYADKEIKVLNSTGKKTQSTPQEVQKTPEQLIQESILAASTKGGSIF